LEYKTSSKEEIKERRKIAEEELNWKISERRETAINKKKEFEKFVMDRSMKIEDEMRKELSEKKSFERNQAENELYEFINDIEKRERSDLNQNFANFNKEKIEEDDDDYSGSNDYNRTKGIFLIYLLIIHRKCWEY